MSCFFCYTESMKRLYEVANEELKNLQQENSPTWNTYAKMSDLITCIKYMQEEFVTEKCTVIEIIEDMKNALGADKTVEIIEKVLKDFCEDVNCISPHLVECLKNKLKEKVTI